MGKGDESCIASDDQSYESTSMSMAIFIQPEPLLNEHFAFKSNDGFLDRVLFFVDRPRPQYAAVIREARGKLKNKEDLISNVILSIFTSHYEKPKNYTFDDKDRSTLTPLRTNMLIRLIESIKKDSS